MLLTSEVEAKYVEWLRMRTEQGRVSEERLAKMDPSLRSEAERMSQMLLAKMAPEGGLGLQPLLEHRRLRYGITDGAFSHQPAYDRMLVYQISQWEGQDTFGDTKIVMPETSRLREREEAPRAIVVAAGALALDHLRSNGMDLGHIVSFVRMAPWRMRFDMVGGKPQHMLVLRDGDIIASEDTHTLLKIGHLKLECNAEGKHVYVTRDGATHAPEQPWISEDY